jgi:hypothetical protein
MLLEFEKVQLGNKSVVSLLNILCLDIHLWCTKPTHGAYIPLGVQRPPTKFSYVISRIYSLLSSSRNLKNIPRHLFSLFDDSQGFVTHPWSEYLLMVSISNLNAKFPLDARKCRTLPH